MKCPRCQRRLAAVAESCLCGWQRGMVQSSHHGCTWEGCKQPAVIYEEIEHGKGRHYLCEFHNVEAHAMRAKRWCESKGLFTVEQKKAYCRKIVGRLLKPMDEPVRDAGQDDEELAA